MSESPQFLRTDKAITQALISLLKVKPFEKITIQDILDEVPVTRSTFYKHFHDKYEIVEKMQDYFFSNQMHIREELLKNPAAYSPQIHKISLQNKEFMEALLNVHTEKVDLRQALARRAELYYLENFSGPNAEVEAQVYAQALTAFQLSNEKRFDFTFEYMDDVFITASLALLGIPNDEDVRKLIKKKLAQKPHFSSNNFSQIAKDDSI